jgi:hypothetical protein
MRLGFVSADGLPVSGFMVLLRNVLALGVAGGHCEADVVADFGYAWRCDKSAFFSAGADLPQPPWLHVNAASTIEGIDATVLAERLTSIRRQIARRPSLEPGEVDALRDEIARLVPLFVRHFGRWIAQHRVDWIIAVNMTLSDAVPATRGLVEAATVAGVPVLHWDHDLYGSCGVVEPGHGRVYPMVPNELCELPRAQGGNLWVVSTEDLQAEGASYNTDLVPRHAPAVLPTLRSLNRDIGDRFLALHGIDGAAPLVHNPVRLTEVKGAHLALDAFSAVCEVWEAGPTPVLLLWGPLLEDEEFAAGLVRQAKAQETFEYVRFLDGVPIATTADESFVRLDEIDLLLLAKRSGGGVVFTPSVPDVETIGLGPALAGLAGLPCMVTPYNALRRVYGEDFAVVEAASCASSDVRDAGRSFAANLGTKRYPDALAERNRAVVARAFDATAWLDVWDEMRAAVGSRCAA